jgi:hypothetical protein
MPEQIDIANLYQTSLPDQLLEYANGLPDGKAVSLLDVLEELGMPSGSGRNAAKKAGVSFIAHVNGVAGGVRAMMANPKTVKKWNEAHKELPQKKR